MIRVSLRPQALTLEHSIKWYVAEKYFSGDFKKLISHRWACYLCLAISAYHVGTVNTEMYDLKKAIGSQNTTPQDLVLKLMRAQRSYPKIEEELKVIRGGSHGW